MRDRRKRARGSSRAGVGSPFARLDRKLFGKRAGLGVFGLDAGLTIAFIIMVMTGVALALTKGLPIIFQTIANGLDFAPLLIHIPGIAGQPFFSETMSSALLPSGPVGIFSVSTVMGELYGKCWKRTTTRERPRETRLWQDTYHEIGRISSWLALPDYVRDEITRIYVNLKAQRSTIKAGLSREKQLARITWLACLIHRLPRTKEEINRGLKELYGFGIGKIPKEFVKAANTRWTKFTLENVGNKTYLYTCERIDGERTRHRCLGTI
jgi:hypothetical protein